MPHAGARLAGLDRLDGAELEGPLERPESPSLGRHAVEVLAHLGGRGPAVPRAAPRRASAPGDPVPPPAIWNDADMWKICWPCWIATTRRLVKLRAVAAAVHLVDDRRIEVAAAQEIRVQRVHGAALDGAAGGRERLPEHLAAEDLRAADVAALAAEQVHLEPLEVEQRAPGRRAGGSSAARRAERSFGHAEPLLHDRARGRVLQVHLLRRIQVLGDRERRERRFVEAAQDQLLLARVGC